MKTIRFALLASSIAALAIPAGAHAAVSGQDGPCSKAQLAAINKAQEAAKSRVLSAKLIVTQSPQRSSDRSQGGAMRGNAARGKSARELAMAVLGVDPKEMDVEAVLANMFTVLTNKSMPARCAQAKESLCGRGAVAYVAKYPRAMSFCPRFFTRSSEDRVPIAESQILTVIHESAHLAGVGFSTADEQYCTSGFSCTRPCGSGNASASADNWAQFVHCASGRKPTEDKVEGSSKPTAQTAKAQAPARAKQPKKR